MKPRIVIILMIVTLAAGCTRQPLPRYTVGGVQSTAEPTPAATATPAPTPQTPLVTSAPPTAAPKVANPAPSAGNDVATKAMKRDIDWLVSRSDEQRGQEENYKNQKKEQYLTVERVTGKDLKFAGKPQVFTGDYTGQLTKGKKYKYFEDASMGGKRYYNVKDNYGVWVIFQYQDPNFK